MRATSLRRTIAAAGRPGPRSVAPLVTARPPAARSLTAAGTIDGSGPSAFVVVSAADPVPVVVAPLVVAVPPVVAPLVGPPPPGVAAPPVGPPPPLVAPPLVCTRGAALLLV